MALWILPKRGLLCVGAKANVPLCGGKKLNKKMCGGEKKKYRRVGKVCRLSSCPFVIWSVCLCLSVKMVYASLVCPSVTVRVARSVFTLCLVLILVDSFSRYPQLDKMTVFYALRLVVHLCFIS